MREANWLNDFVFTVDEFLTPDECENYIRLSEDIGYEDALVTSPRGSVHVPGLRNNQRVIFESQDLAEWLWERAADFVPTEYDGRGAVGVNELLRFYRYDPGEQFNWHQDFAYERDNGERSYLTCLVYLNDGFEGGETSFEDSYSDDSFDEFSVTPQTGMALFFEHPTHHKGEPVRSGRKYVLRTDVMYASDEFDDDRGDGYDVDEEW